MPIHDLSYRHWDGPLRGAGSRWRVIAEAGIRLLLARRKFTAMLMLAWAPALVQAGILYFALTDVQVVDMAIGAQFFQISMAVQFLPLVLVMVWAGSGLIAGDLAAQALPLYFAKPITRLDYIAGKFGVIVLFLLLVYPAPPLVLFLFAAGVAPDLSFLAVNWWVGFAILGYGVLVAVIGSLFILALSSMARSARIASVMFVGLVIFSDMLANLDIARHAFRPAAGVLGGEEHGTTLRRHVRPALVDRHSLGRLARGGGARGAVVRLDADAPHPTGGDRLMSRPVEVSEVSKWYGQVVAVNGMNLGLEPGVTGLLGPNGAGKSTLMKMLTGQIRPSRGRVELLGRIPWNDPDLNRRVGYCPEQDTFYEWMTGRRFVAALLGLAGFERAEAKRRTEAALAEVGMSDVADKKIGGYSKGMRQRIKLAQAIAHDPEVLILDEPVSGLDPVGRRHIIDLVRKWGAQGRTILVSTHILHEVESMTSAVLLIHHGRLLAEGDVHEIRDLIDEHPRLITMVTPDPRALAARLLTEQDVVSVRFERGSRSITAETIRPDEFYRRLPALVLEEGVEIEEMSSPDDNLQAVFDYLVR